MSSFLHHDEKGEAAYSLTRIAMYDQIPENTIYMMLYSAVAMLSLIACCYLLLRQGNAIAIDVTPPVRLRQWTAALFASMTLSHVWYLPIFFSTSAEDILLGNIVGAVLDFLTLIPLAIAVLFVMLQDRRRPLWPVFVLMVPIIIGLVVCGINSSIALLPIISAYYLLLGIGITIYMVRALKQYGRWLRESGYRSYSTFDLALQRTGQTVTAWMRDTVNNQQTDFENQQKSF